MNKEPTPQKPLRLWPGVAAAVLLRVIRFVTPIVVPGSGTLAVIGGLAGALVIVVWWVFFSRAPWLERFGAIVLMAGAPLATSRIVHPSLAKGMMGMMLPIYAVPVLTLALVASAVAGRRRASHTRCDSARREERPVLARLSRTRARRHRSRRADPD